MAPKPSSPTHEAQTLYNKASKAELSRDYDNAFRLYIKAAESFLHLSRTLAQHQSGDHDEQIHKEAKAQAGKALERAEKIKGLRRGLVGNMSLSVDRFSEQEQLRVLLKSSLVNGLNFPLWDSGSDPPSNIPVLFQPALSKEQIRASTSYQSPPLVLPGAVVTPAPTNELVPQDIIQQIISDCSVCTAIAVCIERNGRFGGNLVVDNLYPHDEKGLPRNAFDGNHFLRILFNGGYRRISIDDKLPFSSTGTLMCMSTGRKRCLWPSLVGKAYMKLMGGYDFPGSNSCIDLHALIGWIPEHLEIKGPKFEREKTWSRISQGFTSGNCLITIGTGRDPVQWSGVELLPEHSYAVIGVDDDGGERTLTLLDPWINGSDTTSTSLPTIYPTLVPDNVASAMGRMTIADKPRTMHIPWMDICGLLDSVYVSWNPGLFRGNLVFHGSWKSENQEGENRSYHSQLRLTLPPQSHSHDVIVWVLLTRHVVDRQMAQEYISLRVQVQDDDGGNVRVMVGNTAGENEGTYTNSPHALVRTTIQGSTLSSSTSSALNIIASYEGQVPDVGYTITAYSSSANIQWAEDPAAPPFSKTIEGTLTTKNSGGNCTFPSFMTNPQYHLRIHPSTTPSTSRSPVAGSQRGKTKSRIGLSVEGGRDLPLNVVVVWSSGERITELVENDVAATSGAYNYGYAHTSRELTDGDYTVIVSSFNPYNTGPFTLKVESSQRFDLEPVPSEGAGMYTKTIRGVWDEETSGGGPSSNKYWSNPMFEVRVRTASQIKIRLQLLQPSPSTSLNVTLFSPSGPQYVEHPSTNLNMLSTSGPYSDANSGVITPQINVKPGTYIILPSTYRNGIYAAFRLIVFSSSNVDVEPIEGLLGG
ncbi:hypothetical protein JAAARDRAFT_310571 [Jaapia argillacea MUCL 33604]|uniref:Calpain catalytic domain-containing protein n=1 Tax=Jaapia argillacea MUCL 33604 TaxID=933084 RepID=A0A067PYN1_9AGAM|nr:hypothetical protein JAAARDRAFT_310571 [Jaapia argillacea MUCL 33604]